MARLNYRLVCSRHATKSTNSSEPDAQFQQNYRMFPKFILYAFSHCELFFKKKRKKKREITDEFCISGSESIFCFSFGAEHIRNKGFM